MTLEHKRKELMFSECANPNCKKPFDHREERFFRFSKAYLDGRRTSRYPLCAAPLVVWGLLEKYTLGCQEGWGVVMTLQCVDLPQEQDSRRFVAVA